MIAVHKGCFYFRSDAYLLLTTYANS